MTAAPRLLLALPLLLLGGCSDVPAGAAGIRLTVTWAPELALDQLSIRVAGPDGSLAYEPLVVPESSRALAGGGERVELVLNPLARARVRVDGLAGGDVVAQARTDVEPSAGSFVEASVFLSADLLAVCGDGELTAPIEECDDGNGAPGDGCGETCLEDPDWECGAPGEPCLTRCEPGSLHAYRDDDEDGYGAGAPLEACTPEPLPVGLSDVTGDCDDDDNTVWRGVTLYPDADQDGYTGEPEDLCLDDDDPDGYLTAPSPAPWVSFFGDSARSDDSFGTLAWAEVDGAVYPGNDSARSAALDGVTHYLVVSGFHLDLPDDAVVRGIEVFVRRDADLSVNDAEDEAVTDASVRLVVGGAVTGDERAGTDPWGTGFEVAAYGGPQDAWGAQLVGADVNEPDFGLAFAVRFSDTAGGTPPRAEVDTVRLRVWAAADHPDCNDGDPNRFSVRELATDNDGDAATVGAGSPTCVGNNPPGGLAQLPSRGEDCNDDDNDVYPGQTEYFSGPSFLGGEPSWDFDCDGEETVETLALPSGGTGCACGVDGQCRPVDPIDLTPAGGCGDGVQLELCTDDCEDCFADNRSIGIACR